MDFTVEILAWYRGHMRDLPWRNSLDPYHVWVSEVILQQTRVAQGLGYYHRFIAEFPSIQALAQAPEDRVLKVWQGLGYYSRARHLHASARHIVAHLGGQLPRTYRELLTIKGLGEYSAGAIASFAFREPVPAIDGNVYRVIARIFGLFASPFDAKGKHEFRQLVMELMDREQPHRFNQALLDFGALQCVPRSPQCPRCPFQAICYAHRNNLVNALPVRAKRLIPRDRFFTYIVIRYNQGAYIAKRQGNDIWRSLYEFPLIETHQPLDAHAISEHPSWRRLMGGAGYQILHLAPSQKHQLSHLNLHIQFLVVRIDRPSRYLRTTYQYVYSTDMAGYSVPRPIDEFLAAEPTAHYFRD